MPHALQTPAPPSPGKARYAPVLDRGEDAWHLGYWLWLARRLSPVAVRACMRVGITPNLVTGVSLLSGLLGAVLLGGGAYAGAIGGALLLNLHYLLDSVDGILARVTRRTSVYGAYLDGLTGNLIKPLLFVAVGLAVYRAPHPPFWGIGRDGGRTAFLMLGWVGGLSVVLRKLALLRMRAAIGELPDDGTVARDVGLVRRTPSDVSVGTILRRHTIDLSGSVFPGLLLAALWRRLDVFLLIMAAALSVDLLWSLLTGARRLARAERRLRRRG